MALVMVGTWHNYHCDACTDVPQSFDYDNTDHLWTCLMVVVLMSRSVVLADFVLHRRCVDLYLCMR